MKLIVLSAPSGAGKTTIARRVVERVPGLRFSVSATTRTRREDEVHGEDYFFLSTDEFRERVSAGAFVEYEEVYPGLLYGTLKDQLELLGQSAAIVLDIDVAGALNVKTCYGDEALTLFIKPPSLDVLNDRLIARGTDSAAEIAIRLKKAAFELSHANQFDEVIVNDELEAAIDETITYIEAFLVS